MHGMGEYDAATKFLIEHFAADWLALAGRPVPAGYRPRVVDADLSTVTSVPDKLVRVGTGRRGFVAHVEFQSARDPGLDGRVLTYNVLARARHGVPVRSVVFLLRPAADSPRITGGVRQTDRRGSALSFAYELVRVWRLPPGAVLGGPVGTLPLAPITAVGRGDVGAVIRRMRDRLDAEVPPPLASDLWTATRVLMGLRYDDAATEGILRGVRTMRESVTYQAIKGEGIAEGLAEGLAEGRVDGQRQLLVDQATHKFGRPTAAVLARLNRTADPGELRRLGLRLMDATTWRELLRP